MRTLNVDDAKAHLSRLVDLAVKGEAFVIAKAGKPMVKVSAVEVSEAAPSRIGLLKGWIAVPADFDSVGRDTIEQMFLASK